MSGHCILFSTWLLGNLVVGEKTKQRSDTSGIRMAMEWTKRIIPIRPIQAILETYSLLSTCLFSLLSHFFSLSVSQVYRYLLYRSFSFYPVFSLLSLAILTSDLVNVKKRRHSQFKEQTLTTIEAQCFLPSKVKETRTDDQDAGYW